MEFVNMKVIQNRKEWRHETVMGLIGSRQLYADEAIDEAKKIEKFVFQDDFIVEISNPEQRNALENLIKSITEDSIDVAFRTQLYISLIRSGFKSPVAIQERIKIAEQFSLKGKDVTPNELDEMDLKLKEIHDNTLAGMNEIDKRRNHLKDVLKDPLHKQLRIYKNSVQSYSEATMRDPLNLVLEDFLQINKEIKSPVLSIKPITAAYLGDILKKINIPKDSTESVGEDGQTENTEPASTSPISIKKIGGSELKISGCMPAGTFLYTESGARIKLISAAKYRGDLGSDNPIINIIR